MSDDSTLNTESGTVTGRPQSYERMRKFFFSIALAAAVPILTGAAYLVGYACHRAYLNSFHIPPQLIEKTTADYFLYTYFALVNSSLALLGSTNVVVLALALIVLLFVLWRAFAYLGKRIDASEWARRRRENVVPKPSVLAFADIVILPFLYVALAGYIALALLLILVLPESLGESAGRRIAERDKGAYKLGCDKGRKESRGRLYCNEIREGAELVSRGFIIDSSDKYVAVYEEGVIKLIPLEGKRFVAEL